MNDKEYLKLFTTLLKIEPNRFSCLMIALKEARQLTGRDISAVRQLSKAINEQLH
jgi:hypothetical protein